MIPLLIATALALAPAQDAFDRGDYAQAETLALRGQPGGAALYLAALARFRSGNPQGALDLLEKARAAADPPPQTVWNFNRGACLYELGHFVEAEKAFLRAAEDESLSVVALVNAG